MPSPSGSRRSGFACGAPSREGTRSGQCATGTLSAAPTSGVPRRSKLCIACSDLFYKSERAHAAAPPFQTATAMLGCGLGPPLHGGFVFPWKISILTVLSTFKRLPVSGKSFLLPDPSGSRRSGFACGAPSREGTRSGQRATGTLSIAPTSGVPLVASDNRLR